MAAEVQEVVSGMNQKLKRKIYIDFKNKRIGGICKAKDFSKQIEKLKKLKEAKNDEKN